jgi:plasmid stability protein
MATLTIRGVAGAGCDRLRVDTARNGRSMEAEVRAMALTLRLPAMGTMRRVVDGLTADQLASRTEPFVGAGWPPEGATFVVRECLLVVTNGTQTVFA